MALPFLSPKDKISADSLDVSGKDAGPVEKQKVTCHIDCTDRKLSPIPAALFLTHVAMSAHITSTCTFLSSGLCNRLKPETFRRAFG